MTDAFYVAVKGSLHASDSCVFGLSNEELAAISKRFGNVKKEVINGILIKANPLEVINCLSELGYRVACSSGEAEMVWTLRREVLHSRPSHSRAPAAIPRQYRIEEIQEPKIKEPPTYTIPTFKKPEKSKAKVEKPVTVVQKIGTRPKDLETYGYEGSRILVIDPDEIENVTDDQKVIVKTNLDSEDNPMLDPWVDDDKNTCRRRQQRRGM
ncbi:hypothetical protein O3M35_005481 [Rhynocoris fuscipes]|uniref:Uncharacterized protein n=1 Tax=Rhynocoris fuscipes TaxID=488301 RepID=A0AAW1DIT6_9HEMI